MEIEKLDVSNIIEIQKIRQVLINHPDLLSMFELLVIMSNNRLNNDCKIIFIGQRRKRKLLEYLVYTIDSGILQYICIPCVVCV